MENAETAQAPINILTCQRCGKKAPEFNDQGKHNFCPASEGTKIVNLCMECKMKEVGASWAWSGMQ